GGPAGQDPEAPAEEPPAGVPLNDPESGLVVEPATFTALVSSEPHETALVAERLGRFVDDGVALGGTRLADMALATVRRRIVVSEADPGLFAGAPRAVPDPRRRADEGELEAASAGAHAQE